MSDGKSPPENRMLAIGLAFGVVFGKLLDNIALGIAVGPAIEIGADQARKRSAADSAREDRED